MNKEFKPELEEGVVGSQLVQWFRDNENRDNLPVEAEYLGSPSNDEVNYRLSFEDGTVADWHVVFQPASGLTFHIETMWEYNRVI